MGSSSGLLNGPARISFLVFSCITTCTFGYFARMVSVEPMWSGWLWVLMISTTGLSVTFFTSSRIAWPLPGILVSTSTTPAFCTTTRVFPPPPKIL